MSLGVELPKTCLRQNMPSNVLKNLVQNFLTAWKVPRWRWALVIAALSDAVGFGLVLIPPVEWLLDGVTAGVLFAILGFRWPLFLALAVEAVPGLQLFPAWILVVAALAGTETEKRTNGTGAVEHITRLIQKP
jgi:hypothetical protein